MGRILTYLSLLMPAFSLLYRPPLLSVWLLPIQIAPLPLLQDYCYSLLQVLSLKPILQVLSEEFGQNLLILFIMVGFDKNLLFCLPCI